MRILFIPTALVPAMLARALNYTRMHVCAVTRTHAHCKAAATASTRLMSTTAASPSPPPSPPSPPKEIPLEPDHPIVTRLFRPFVRAHFPSDEAAAEELRWLRHHAVLFGLDPVRHLQLPTTAFVPSPPLDQRYAAELAHARDVRRKKEQRQLEREIKQKKNQVHNERRQAALSGAPMSAASAATTTSSAATSSAANQELFDEYADDVEEGEVRKEVLPLRLRPRIDREAYREHRVKTIGDLMAGMDERVRKWKEARRLQRRERKNVNPLAVTSGKN